MLVLTDNATEIISSLVDRRELPDGAGLRIAATGAGSGLAVSTAAEPADADRIVEEHGVRVFVDSDAAPLLDDKVLDARVTDEGAIEFLLAVQ